MGLKSRCRQVCAPCFLQVPEAACFGPVGPWGLPLSSKKVVQHLLSSLIYASTITSYLFNFDLPASLLVGPLWLHWAHLDNPG